MDFGSWTLEVDPDRIAWLTCDTPRASTNVLSAPVLRELSAALRKITELKPAGVVVRSAKPNGFIAGADIKEFLNVRTPDDARAITRRTCYRLLTRAARVPLLTRGVPTHLPGP